MAEELGVLWDVCIGSGGKRLVPDYVSRFHLVE
jgi:hypothetical protein